MIPDDYKEILATENCTKCGKKFEKGTGRFPYPEKQVLCKDCFFPALDTGLSRLNKVIGSFGGRT